MIKHVALLEFEVLEFWVRVYDTPKAYVKVTFENEFNNIICTKYFLKGEYLRAKIAFTAELLMLSKTYGKPVGEKGA